LTALSSMAARARLPILDSRQRPLHDLRISLTDHCNLRCTYCMPKDSPGGPLSLLPTREYLSFEQISRLVGILARLGLRKVKLTGGEPLVRPGLPQLVKMLRESHPTIEVNLITNGVLLGQFLSSLQAAGLGRLTVSLDTLKPDKFARLTGNRSSLESVTEGISMALAAGFSPIKINMVVIRGVNDDEVESMAAFFRRKNTILRFIEYMDVGTRNGWRRDDVVSSASILERLRQRWDLEPLEVKDQHQGETARRYRYADGQGEVGFISSITEPFCATCSRLRLSSDGKLYTCLFARDGFDVRASLRTTAGDDEVERALAELWTSRRDQYSLERSQHSPREKIEMFYIGG